MTSPPRNGNRRPGMSRLVLLVRTARLSVEVDGAQDPGGSVHSHRQLTRVRERNIREAIRRGRPGKSLDHLPMRGQIQITRKNACRDTKRRIRLRKSSAGRKPLLLATREHNAATSLGRRRRARVGPHSLRSSKGVRFPKVSRIRRPRQASRPDRRAKFHGHRRHRIPWDGRYRVHRRPINTTAGTGSAHIAISLSRSNRKRCKVIRNFEAFQHSNSSG